VDNILLGGVISLVGVLFAVLIAMVQGGKKDNANYIADIAKSLEADRTERREDMRCVKKNMASLEKNKVEKTDYKEDKEHIYEAIERRGGSRDDRKS
jgi:flagellar motility protein MotE (MotC chaperone)